MVAKKITSLQHPNVLYWVSLRENARLRKEKKSILIAGKALVKEAPIEILITSKELPSIKAQERYIVTEEILKKITGLKNPDGFAAIAKCPEPQDLSKKKFLVILDKISDPGNLGTLLRTALALGWEGVIVTPTTVDLFNDKVLRAAKGAHFHLPYARLSIDAIKKLKIELFTADIKGKELDRVSFKGPRALILSNETHGPDPKFSASLQKITIPMSPMVESLNVAASGAILLYAMRPK